MVIPSLIVGMGGAGQWVAAYLKHELLAQTPGRQPAAARLLVFDTAQRFRVAPDSARQTGLSLLSSLDEPGEYYFLGQEIGGYVREAADGLRPHLDTWFLAREHAAILERYDFDWGRSTASFRQLGRLVLFQDVQMPARSRLYSLMSDTIGAIRDESRDKSLQIVIIASLVGTCGAGMAFDVAYLARRLAQRAGLNATLRAFLLLPEAFRALADAEALPAMRARAYAALRELRRLCSDASYQVGGVPFLYHGEGEDALWRGELKGRLFDYVYLMDGKRANAPLCEVPLEHGLAPGLADAILTLLDPEAGQLIRENKLNLDGVEQERKRQGSLASDAVTCGALGTYTIAFPIEAMLRGWSLRLAREVLDVLLRPVSPDPQSGLPTRLSSKDNAEQPGHRGRDEVDTFLSSPRVPDPADPRGGVDLTPWVAMVGRWARETGDESRLGQGKPLPGNWEDWLAAFELQGHDDSTRQLRQRVGQAFRSHLADPGTIASPRGAMGQPLAESVAALARQVADFEEKYLGVEDPDTGQYVGGRCWEVLEQCQSVHLHRFGLALSYHLRIMLNGANPVEARRSKAGKLGYAHDFVSNLAVALDRVLRRLKAAQASRAIQHDQRLDLRAVSEHTRREMVRVARRGGLLRRRQMAKLQERYLEHEQKLVDLRRMEVMDEVAVQTVGQMLHHVQHLFQRFGEAMAALALGQKSVYGELLRAQRALEKERAIQDKVVVRWTIHDTEYEEQRYQAYTRPGGQDAVDRILADLTWQVDHELRLVCTGARPKGSEARPDLLAPGGAEALVALGRLAFDDAPQTESALGYLMHAFPRAGDLADRVHTRSGVALGHAARDPILANYLRIARPRTPQEQSYVEAWLARLQQLANRGVTTGSRAQRFAPVVYSDDRFHCSLLQTEELVPLDTLDAVGPEARDDYWNYRQEFEIPRLDRRFLHILPAEVNAARYEGQLDPPRFLVPEVVVHLERLDRMRLFLLASLYGLIDKEVRQAADDVYTVWILGLPPGGDQDRWLLTPEGRTGDRLEALTTFSFVGRDQERPHEYWHLIPYDRIEELVKQLRQDDARQRVQAGTAGQHLGHWRNILETLTGPEQESAALAAGHADRMIEEQARLRAEIAAAQQKLRQSEAQHTIDLLSVFALMLQEEIECLLGEIKQQITYGVGGIRTLPWGRTG